MKFQLTLLFKVLLFLKKILFFVAVSLLVYSCKKNIPAPPEPQPEPPVVVDDTSHLTMYTNKTITIVNWNIEWFGSSNFSGNKDVQENNASKILKYLNADIYGICEVVDTARFGKMIRYTFGDDFRYTISPYPNVSQKMAFVYNRNIFRNVKARPFMGLSSTAAKSFASGRFPFLLEADMAVNNTRQKVSIILIHAKAGADAASYTSRLNGAVEMKDSLDRFFAQKNVAIIGDFNDNFNGSITAGKITPYQNFLNDTKYNAVTYPLNANGYSSTITFVNSVIDQQVYNAGFAKWYVNSSAKIRTDVKTVIPNYDTRNTSDHYPVSSEYKVK